MSHTTSARLASKVELCSGICAFTFEATEAPFDGLQAGAHIDVHLVNDVVRSYSLTEWDEAGRWVSVAVKKEPDGRGGSVAMHDLRIGDVLEVSAPRNNFPLNSDEQPIVLVAGGIGITPLYAMARFLRAREREFDLHYMVRTQDLAAFDVKLSALDLGDRYHLHRDDVDGLPDFTELVESYPEGTHFYVCGPEVMLVAIQKAVDELGSGRVFFERFAAGPVSPEGDERPFRIIINSTGDEFEVPTDKSILQVLREAGRDIDYGCAEGVCGTCVTDVLDGDIDHRDFLLTEEERLAGDCMCICVSRAASPRLVLDL